MSRTEDLKGILKVFWSLLKEDFDEMDHKLLRIAAGIIGFVISAIFWFYVFRRFSPF